MSFARGYPDEVYSLRGDGRAAADDGGTALDIRVVLVLLWRARIAMVVGALVGLTVALGYMASRAPTFTASAKVLFSPGERGVVDLDGLVVKAPSEGLQNQIEILRSSHFLGRVVQRAKLDRHPAFNPALRPSLGVRATRGALSDGLTRLPGRLLRLAGLGTDGAGEAGEAGEAAAGASADAPPPDGAGALTARRILAGRMHLDPVADSSVIRISVTTGEPDLSARLSNVIAQEYITARLDAKLAATREATRWLSARVAELKQELSAAEAEVARLGVALAAGEGRSKAQIEAELRAVNQAIAAATTARSAAEVRYGSVRAAIDDPDRAATSFDLESSDLIRRTRLRVRELAIERAELAALVSPGHERLGRIDAQLAAAREEIAREAERIALVLYNQLTVEAEKERRLRERARALHTRLGTQDEAEVKLRAHQREVEASRLIYETFLSRLKETTQQAKLTDADAMIISPAERPGSPDSTARLRVAALGSVLGAMAGLGVALVLDRLNNAFRALEDVEEVTGLTVVGTIPLVAASGEHGGVLDYMMNRPNSALAESIRSLRTSLLYSDAETPPQVVVFTSSVPAEGKSTTSLLLAFTSAQMGKATIIVDCDMRRPKLSGMLGTVGAARGGLRAVLEGSLSLDQACLRDPETGLTILPSSVDADGGLNAADALASRRFGELMKRLRERYELVVLDAPPTLSVTDARLVARSADATFYCIRWNETPRETVIEGLREFSIVRPNIAGAVVTMVDMTRARRDGALYDYRAGASDPYHIN